MTAELADVVEVESEIKRSYREGPFTVELIGVGGFLMPWPEYICLCEQTWAMSKGLA